MDVHVRFRVVLPTVLGSVAAALMLWDLHNQGVIESMGMWWDTGQPVWPYQAPFLLLSAINLPAFILASPLFLLPHLELTIVRYPTLLPVIVCWWWWVGTRVDFGILGHRHYRSPRMFSALLTVAAAGLLCAGVWATAEVADRWSRYPAHLLVSISSVISLLWVFALFGATLLAILRLIQRRFRAVSEQRAPTRIHIYGFGLAAMVAVATSVTGVVRQERIANSCIASSDSGCIHGTIADNEGRPIKGIPVEILPADNRGEKRWPQSTDSKGRYSANILEPGEYLVAVHYHYFPHEHQPFASAFYPGVGTEEAAEYVVVRPNSRTMLKQFQLRRLPLITLGIDVACQDGTRPEWSNLSIRNLGYPPGASFFSPGFARGTGEFELLEGFDYDLYVYITCNSPRARRTSPTQRVSTREGELPEKLTFTIPGEPFKPWR